MTSEELELLQLLDSAINRKREGIEIIAKLTNESLENDPSAIIAWETIPLEFYGCTLPEEIKSSWVFVLRKNLITGAERHPNSIQRMMSFCGGGDFQTKPGSEWISHFLRNDPDSELEKRWISIPRNVWHQGVVGGENWAVVSFQTAPASELIEERPDENDTGTTHQKKYLDQ